jgi:hypothetical protein
MTALQSIIKEAKAIRKKSPKMEWKKAVAQASAIYASKHKGKSPVGKKHAVKKKAAKKKSVKRVGVIKKKAIRKSATKRKPTEKTVLKSIKRAVSVQKAHMSGLHKADHTIISKYKHTAEEIARQTKYLHDWQNNIHNVHHKADKLIYRTRIKEIKKYISELKNHARELKKLLK